MKYSRMLFLPKNGSLIVNTNHGFFSDTQVLFVLRVSVYTHSK